MKDLIHWVYFIGSKETRPDDHNASNQAQEYLYKKQLIRLSEEN